VTGRLPILTFHDLSDEPSVLSTRPGLFASGMARLAESGFSTLSLTEAADLVRQAGPWPERRLVITFDDGHRGVFTHALPVLERLGFSATVFLTVGEAGPGGDDDALPSLEDRPMLTWGQVRRLRDAGWTIGAHTLTHPDLTALSDARCEWEISASKAFLEDAMGEPVTSFAYPFGRFDRRTRRIVAEHFSCACSDRLAQVTARSDPWALERVDAYYLRSARRLGSVGSRAFRWYVRARAIPRNLRRAVSRG